MMTTKTGVNLELPDNLILRRRVIKDHYPVEVLCPECFDIVFFYRQSPVRGRQLVPGDAMDIGGQRPNRIHPTLECPNCKAEVAASRLTWRGKSW